MPQVSPHLYVRKKLTRIHQFFVALRIILLFASLSSNHAEAMIMPFVDIPSINTDSCAGFSVCPFREFDIINRRGYRKRVCSDISVEPSGGLLSESAHELSEFMGTGTGLS